MAMLGGSEEVVEMLIRYGGDVMMDNIEGEQPIHFAAAEDAGDIIVLLAKGGMGRLYVNKNSCRFSINPHQIWFLKMIFPRFFYQFQ